MTIYKITLQIVFLLISLFQFSCRNSVAIWQEKSYVELDGLELGKDYLKVKNTYFSAIPTVQSEEKFYNYFEKNIDNYFIKINLNLKLAPKKNTHCTIKFPGEIVTLRTLEQMAEFKGGLEIEFSPALNLFYSPNVKKFYVSIPIKDWLTNTFPSLFKNDKENNLKYVSHISLGTITKEEIERVFPEVQENIIEIETLHQNQGNFFLLGKKLSKKISQKLEEKLGPIQFQNLPKLILERIKLERFDPKKLGDGSIPIANDIKRPNLLPKVIKILKSNK